MDCVNKKLVCLALMFLSITTSVITVKGGVNCKKMFTTMEGCLDYIKPGGSSTPSRECCKGVKTVFNSAKNATDRQEDCQCLKDAAKKFSHNVDPKRAAKLASDCGVNLPYHITPNFDCKSIKN